MTVKPADTTTLLDDRLAELEVTLSTPRLSGELSEWSQRVCQAAQGLASVLEVELAQLRQEQFQVLLAEDTSLACRVDEIKAADEANRRVSREIAEQLCGIASETAARSDAETEFQSQVAELAEAGLRLVVDVRKQETAMNTWYQEAFQRDRGVAD